MNNQIKLRVSSIWRSFSLLFLVGLFVQAGCYSFREGQIDPLVKTIKINFFENKASYVNPNLSPKLTDRFRQKIVNQTRLIQTNNDDAHYVISAKITGYSVSTSGISQQQAASNRLTVMVEMTWLNNLTGKTEVSNISRSFDFSANLSLQQAESSLEDEILRNLTDEMFNKIFSNW